MFIPTIITKSSIKFRRVLDRNKRCYNKGQSSIGKLKKNKTITIKKKAKKVLTKPYLGILFQDAAFSKAPKPIQF